MASMLNFKGNKSKTYISGLRIVLCLVIIILITWLCIYYFNVEKEQVSVDIVLDSPSTIYANKAMKVKQPLKIQCNSWRYLNQHIVLMNKKGKVFNSSRNMSQFKIELGLAGPRTISLFNPSSGKYLTHCTKSNTVSYQPVNHLTDMKARVSASWIPYVSLEEDGTRTYMFSPIVNKLNNNKLTTKWLQSNGTSIGSNAGKFLMKLVDIKNKEGINWEAPKMHSEVARQGDTSTQDYPTRVVCNARQDTQEYRDKQNTYMSQYYEYYNKENAETARVKELLTIGGPYNKNHNREGFNDASSGMRRGDRRKRTVKALKMNGMLDDLIIKEQELFMDMNPPNSVSDAPSMDEFNPGKSNVFKPHTGLQFNDILNHHAASIKHDATDDRLFDRLEKAKMDPSVQNLLDYNEERAAIYTKENEDFDQRLSKRVKQNKNQTDNLVRRMDQHRIRDMSKKLFFLQNYTK